MQKIEIEINRSNPIKMKTPLFSELDIPMLAFAKSAATLLADLVAAVTSSYKVGFDFFAEPLCSSKTTFQTEDFNLGKITF